MNDKTISIIVRAQDQASKVLGGIGDTVSNVAGKLASAGLLVAKVAGTAVAGAMTLAAKASWDQVGAVEQATVGLRAYEKNADAVNGVLKDLITYARSDMGVLFNRKDLFQSAQMLKLNGVATQDLSKNVQILSRSVGLGLGNWQDLNSVVGRVVSTGRLSGIEFDQLTQYGYKLDKSLRNTNISATDLFKALDKGIPVDAMEGQANTIQGLGIRFQSAFRGIGDAILGVDTETSKFVEGGLGDRLSKGLSRATELLKEFAPQLRNSIMPAVGEVIDKITEFGKQAADYLAPKIKDLAKTIEDAKPTFDKFYNETLKPIADALGGAFIWSIGLVIDGFKNMVSGAEKVVDYYNNSLKGTIEEVGNFLSEELGGTLDSLKQSWNEIYIATQPFHEQLKMIGGFIGAVIIGALTVLAFAILGLITVISNLVEWGAKVIAWLVELGVKIEEKMKVFREAVWNALSNVIDWFKELPGKIGNAIGNLASTLYQKGKDLIQGLIDGAGSLLSKLANFFLDKVPAPIKEAFKKAFGIHSPSKVFSGYGKNLVEGLANGVTSNLSIAKNAIDSLNSTVEMPLSGTDLSGNNGSSSAFNMYGNINLGDASAVDRFFERLDTQKEMGALGAGV